MLLCSTGGVSFSEHRLRRVSRWRDSAQSKISSIFCGDLTRAILRASTSFSISPLKRAYSVLLELKRAHGFKNLDNSLAPPPSLANEKTTTRRWSFLNKRLFARTICLPAQPEQQPSEPAARDTVSRKPPDTGAVLRSTLSWMYRRYQRNSKPQSTGIQRIQSILGGWRTDHTAA